MNASQHLIPAVRSAIKGAAAAADLIRRPAPGVTILIYHRVGAGSGAQMDLSPAVFESQLAWLAGTQRVLALDEALDELTAEPGTAANSAGVVLTFDDGTTDWIDNVLPALQRHGLPATFYLATSFIEDSTAFPGDGKPLSWDAVKELASSELVTVGSHTHRHLLLDRLDAAGIDDELDRSIELLGSRAGVTARHFAYPKAVLGSPGAQAAIRARFRSAVVAGTRANPVGADPYRLHRSPIQASDGTRWFRRKAIGGLRAEDDLRQLANRVRYRHLDS